MFDIDQHTADIRVRLVAPTAEELFADGIRALMAVMKPGDGGEASAETVELEAPDLTSLLVDLLNEVLLRCHIRRCAYHPESIVLHASGVIAKLAATAVTDFDEDVKAVTYHEAEVRQGGDGSWSTTLVLDV